MKLITPALLVALFLTACQPGAEKQAESTPEVDETTVTEETSGEAEVTEASLTYYGDTITMDDAIPATELMAKMGDQEELDVKLAGTINSSCRKKGCWMKVATGEGEEMMVRFKDYGFFVPKDADGFETVFEGKAKITTVSVEDQRHLAEDGGASEKEIAAITEPKTGVEFEAIGVIIKDYVASEATDEEGAEGEEATEAEPAEETEEATEE